MANYVSKDGLLYFWTLLKSKFVSVDVGVTHTKNTKVGSTTKGVYVDTDGSVKEMTYSLGQDVTSSSKLTDHITTATTSGSGNAVTSVTADANGALTVTKGTTFLTSHQSNLNLGQCYATCATAQATVAKTVTMANYVLATGGIVAIKFTYAVPASATLNINSKGAKNIFNKGATIKAGVINAGDTAFFMYDGSQYQLLGVDRASNDTITGLSVSGKTITYTKADGSTGTITTQDTDTKATVTVTGSGNAITNITDSNGALTATKGATFLTEHQSLDGYATETWVENKNYLQGNIATANADGHDFVEICKLRLYNSSSYATVLGCNILVSYGLYGTTRSGGLFHINILNRSSEASGILIYRIGGNAANTVGFGVYTTVEDGATYIHLGMQCNNVQREQLNAYVLNYANSSSATRVVFPMESFATKPSGWQDVEIKTYLTEHQSLAGYATESWVTGKGYLTAHQDISGKADKTYVDTELDKKATKATTLAGYGITNAYTKTEIDTKLTSAMRYKGSVAAYANLPTTNLTVGDMYNVTATGANYVWDGSAWDETGMIVDLSAYAKTADLVAVTNSEIDTIVAS